MHAAACRNAAHAISAREKGERCTGSGIADEVGDEARLLLTIDASVQLSRLVSADAELMDS
jgi:hypothetical protein